VAIIKYTVQKRKEGVKFEETLHLRLVFVPDDGDENCISHVLLIIILKRKVVFDWKT
jgi:hypothetical protein